MKTIRIDYQDKIIYLGIDVHKRTYSVTVICEGQIIKRDTITANPAVLVAYLRRCFPGAGIGRAYQDRAAGLQPHGAKPHRSVLSCETKRNGEFG
jgi:hypothetical protein